MWIVIAATIALVAIAVGGRLAQSKKTQPAKAAKGLVEARINFRLKVYWGIAGLDAPETAPLLALRAAVRQEKLFPVFSGGRPCSTEEEAELWVEQNLELMAKVDPQKVEELAAPEREELKTAFCKRHNSG